MRHFTPYFEADGSYNERHFEKRPPRPPELVLDFDRTAESQLRGKVLPEHLALLEDLFDAYRLLNSEGCLPENHARRLRKQITVKAERCIRTWNRHTV